MFERLQKLVLQMTVQGEQKAQTSTLRKFFIGAGNLARKPQQFAQALSGLTTISDKHHAELSSWVAPEALANGEGGAFDACDLRHWLILADRAGVPYIPAREILTLNEEELSLLSGTIPIPSTPATRRLQAAIPPVPPSNDQLINTAHIDREALSDRLFDAMDDVPEGWMVRSNRCGGSELKALAGVGITGDRAPEVRFGPNLEVGPGWVRNGNRRRVNTSDKRTVTAAAQGPGFLVFLARPWVESSRYLVAADPHREGSPFAGNGVWPAEWRAFVENGQVVGVASYYGWADTASPVAARSALEARRLAQKIVDQAIAQKAWPRYSDIELVRDAAWVKANPALDHQINVEFGRETISCTIDFLETKDGLVFLEAGPGASPVGGGHPCAFAGTFGKPSVGKILTTKGVAFRTRPDVLIADPQTWVEGDNSGFVFNWDEVEALAAEDEA